MWVAMVPLTVQESLIIDDFDPQLMQGVIVSIQDAVDI